MSGLSSALEVLDTIVFVNGYNDDAIKKNDEHISLLEWTNEKSIHYQLAEV